MLPFTFRCPVRRHGARNRLNLFGVDVFLFNAALVRAYNKAVVCHVASRAGAGVIVADERYFPGVFHVPKEYRSRTHLVVITHGVFAVA